MRLQVRLLGPFEARRESGETIRLPTRKAAALLAVLAAKPGQRHGREQLATMLWPDSGEAQGRGSLRQTLSLLRHALGASDRIGSPEGKDAVSLDANGVDVDVQRLEAAAASRNAEELEQAVAAYRGDFLANLAIDSEPFEEWRRNERERLRDLANAAYGRLVDAYVAAGEFSRAATVGERMLAFDPASEAAYRALMRVHVAQGERGAAVRLYQRCKRYLEVHLGVAPSPETEALHRQIVDSEARQPPVPTRNRPSIAVVPFANLSDDPAQSLLAQAVVEDIIAELSRFRTLRVIARHSAFVAHRPGRSVRDSGAELGATYVLDGSLRRSEGAVRISAQLTEVATDSHIWADRYDVPLERLHEVQDRITRAVAGALALRIDEELLQQAKARADPRPAAYDCWLRGKECLFAGTRDGHSQARDFFLRALDVEPGYGRAHAGLAMVYMTDWNCHNWSRWNECEKEAFEHARKAVTLDDSDHVAHCVLSRVHLYRRAFEQVEKHVDRSLTLNANDADCLARAAATKTQLGEASAGIELGDLAFSLNPRYPDWYVGFIGLPYLMAARHAEAIAIMERAPDAYIDTRALLAAAHAYLGQPAAARIHADAFFAGYRDKIAQGRDFDGTEAMRWLLQVIPFRLESDTKYLRKGLKKAGIGE